MDRKRRASVILVLSIAMVLALCGCGSTKSAYAGTWRCAYMDNGSTVMTAGDMATAGTELYVTLKDDGQGTMTADGETQKIRWEETEDGTSLLLTIDGEQEVFTIGDEGLIWDLDGTAVTFLPEKSDGYQEALETYTVVRSSAGTD